ncbi:MAG: hypothetical protein KDK51_07580 [Deltaproteobacteria bacterium]|nr:hypothetical protein [Deltaproteobacteria bacterium]
MKRRNLIALLLIVVFSMQGCGRPPLDGGGSEKKFTDTGDLKPGDLFLDLCFGQNNDGDGKCNDEEEPGCENDAYCEDDADEVIDGLYGNGSSNSTMGRWLALGSLAAVGGIAAYGLVGISGVKQPFTGKKKWGWLYNLIKRTPEVRDHKFLRLVDKDSELKDALLTVKQVSTYHFFYKTFPGGKETWVTTINKSTYNKNLASILYGSRLRSAGHTVMTCTTGRTGIVSVSDTTYTNAKQEDRKMHQGLMTVMINGSYAKDALTIKKVSNENDFITFCKNQMVNGGYFMALELKDGAFWVHPMPHGALAAFGPSVSQSNLLSGFDMGYQVNVNIRIKDGQLITDPLPASIDANDTFNFYTSNTNGTNESAMYKMSVSSAMATQYGMAADDETRINVILGYISSDAEIDIDAVKENIEHEETDLEKEEIEIEIQPEFEKSLNEVIIESGFIELQEMKIKEYNTTG